eukprot:2957989-Rhodomonas_salina.1
MCLGAGGAGCGGEVAHGGGQLEDAAPGTEANMTAKALGPGPYIPHPALDTVDPRPQTLDPTLSTRPYSLDPTSCSLHSTP